MPDGFIMFLCNVSLQTHLCNREVDQSLGGDALAKEVRCLGKPSSLGVVVNVDGEFMSGVNTAV